ncbi:MAG TPA: serine O-acetyltransferase [Longimicrobiales bacterium]
MTFRELRYLIASDVYRYHGRYSRALLLRECALGFASKVAIWLRVAAYLKGRGWPFFPLYVVARLLHRRYCIRFGVEIPYSTQIGPGLYIGHYGAVVISSYATIGRNCNLSQGVTVGVIGRGARAGAPRIGDNVYLGPGCKVIGGVSVGNDVAVGANCVVTRDVPDHAVVVGVPGRVISMNGSEAYIHNADYDARWRRRPTGSVG